MQASWGNGAALLLIFAAPARVWRQDMLRIEHHLPNRSICPAGELTWGPCIRTVPEGWCQTTTVHSVSGPSGTSNIAAKATAGSGASISSAAGIEELYRDYWKELCRQLRRSFGPGPPDPEDVVQAAFARLAALDHPDRVHNPRAFLFTTARNLVLDHKRRQKLHFDYAQAVLATHSTLSLDELTPERVYLNKERFEIIRDAVEKLPHKQRVILGLHRHRGYTYQQIASETGWSYGDVYRQMEAALASLSDAMKR
jgi:RNA polymerase sigma factor (sigma-70 family)